MSDLVKSVAISVAANAVSLAFAAWVFSGFQVRLGWFLVSIVFFTILTVALRGVVVRTVNRFARGYTIVGGLVLTFLALLVTDWVVPGDGFSIEGWATWIGVTLIVWAAGVAYGEIDSTRPPEKRPTTRLLRRP